MPIGVRSQYGHDFVDGWWKSLRQQYAIDGDPDLKDEIGEQLECGYESI